MKSTSRPISLSRSLSMALVIPRVVVRSKPWAELSNDLVVKLPPSSLSVPLAHSLVVAATLTAPEFWMFSVPLPPAAE